MCCDYLIHIRHAHAGVPKNEVLHKVELVFNKTAIKKQLES